MPPAAAPAVSDDTAINNLNSQRRAAGIPAGIRIRPSLSQGCRNHNRYMDLNNTVTHFEERGRPGYTASGNRAGRTSVLGLGAPPWRNRFSNPWETAPIHLSQTLDPTLKVTGYDESRRHECLVTLAGPRRAPPDSIRAYTYPGPGMAIYRAECAGEAPKTPGQLVGIRAGRRTGPYLILLLDGPNRAALDVVRIVEASLRKVGGGRVAIRAIGSGNQNLGGGWGRFRLYVPPSAFVIPVRPLDPRATYVAHLAVNAAGRRVVEDWRFRTNRRVEGFC